ncbi:MAG: Gfo/Idh/MocA family oxidoreductase [Bacteroidales bacterium]|nr:Gfo/Idh/MocA family oxidoreductase [Bacteroidales bacterium]
MNNTIFFAVAGCGHIGKRHATMIIRQKGAELLSLCDILPKEECGATDFEAPFFQNYKDMLDYLEQQSGEIVVNICTPNGLHASMAIQALERGFHVVVEKPMALKRSDAELLLHTALRQGKQLFCVMQNRYSPPSVWLKELVESGKLGQIYQVIVHCFWNRDERYYKKGGWHGSKDLDGGTLFTQFSHFIDILYWLFGDIKNIKGHFFDFNHKKLTDFEDSGSILFDFVKEGSGALHYSTAVWDTNLESSLTIIAENGSIKVGGQYMNEVEYCHIKNYEMPQLAPTNPGNDYGAYKGSAQNHHYVIENVVSVLQGNTTITTNALEGLKVVDIIERIYQVSRKENSD